MGTETEAQRVFDRVCDCLDRQIAFYHRRRREMKGLCVDGEKSAFLVDQNQASMQHIENIEREMSGLLAEWNEAPVSDAQRLAVRERADEARLLAETLADEMQAAAALTEDQRAALKSEIDGISRSRATAQKYRAPGTDEQSRLDRRA